MAKRTSSPLDQVLAGLPQPLRAWSLIVTVFGDCVIPRGGSLWLGTLLAIMERTGIEAGVVRTAASRLVSDGWIVRERIGRNSFYRLSPKAERETACAARRVYALGDEPADGPWTLAIIRTTTANERAGVREKYIKAGAGQLSQNTLVAPPGRSDLLADVPGLILDVTPRDTDTERRLAKEAWPLHDIEKPYAAFMATFAPAIRHLDAGSPLPPLDALALRILIVHEWRRIVLRNPDLPPRVLGDGWSGSDARRTAARLWRAMLGSSEQWLDANGKCLTGRLPPDDGTLARRFSAGARA
jgi:phenylacetic acid degradation operon negative regulatory protein